MNEQSRPCYLAGQWYPGTEIECRDAIEAYCVAEPSLLDTDWYGLVAPHAGWQFSGGTAVAGYQRLAAVRREVDLVVIFGSHMGDQDPHKIFRGRCWQTPLGELETAISVLEQSAFTEELSTEPVWPTVYDNAVEVNLPFIRFFFPQAQLLVVGVAPVATSLILGAQVGQACRDMARQAVFIASTDLTHYGASYGFVPHGIGAEAVAWVRDINDQGFIKAVLDDAPEALLRHAQAHRSACCPGACASMLEAVRSYRGDSTSGNVTALVEHSLSYDVHPADSFVGYGSVLIGG